MSDAMPGLQEQKLITAILPAEIDHVRLMHRVKDELGINTGNLNFARGTGAITRDKQVSAEETQREILTVVVEPGRADEIFAWLFEAADIDRPHGGIIFMQTLAAGTAYTLPDVPEEAED